MFQKNIINKYIKTIDSEIFSEKYQHFTAHFHNSDIQANIRHSKEEQYQEGFLRDLFVNILGYTLNPATGFNLTTELKNLKGSKKCDGAILRDDKALAVIELKGMDTTDLSSIETQAFGYKNNHPTCRYVITANFQKLRFYIDNAVEFLEFDLFHLTQNEFNLLYLLLHKDNLLADLPLKIKQESISQEEKITHALYKDYSAFKRLLFADLCQNNPQIDQLTLFTKAQKLLDRLLFIFFAEDGGLLTANTAHTMIKEWEKFQELKLQMPIYEQLKRYFGFLNTGYKDKTSEIFAYNGGLFKPDEILDSVIISDNVLYDNIKKLADYDYSSEIDVNILGHIFENSLNEIDEIKAQLGGETIDKTATKRKKDGVFYTPKYITSYIVQNTVGKLCADKKLEIGIIDTDYTADKKRQKKTQEALLAKLKDYRAWLLEITICDPACGSGAFLNEALNFLMAEHRYLDELESKLFGGGLVFQEVRNHILEHNLFGVDINPESVEIAKLSLWLRTAEPHRKLSNLNENIKCGNSLISEKQVAGELAFDWQKEFPKVFVEKSKLAFHITTAIHDSRTSQRMIDYKVRELRHNSTMPDPQVVPFSPEEELIVTQTIAELVKEKGLNIIAYNICIDHLHILLVCEENEVSKIMQLIKGRTAYNVNKYRNNMASPDNVALAHCQNTNKEALTPCENGDTDKGLKSPCQENEPYNNAALAHCEKDKGLKPPCQKKNKPIWTQKFGCKMIEDEEQLYATINYIETNRQKHEIQDTPAFTKALDQWISQITCTYEQAFMPEYKGGFDVVIGNPPYVSIKGINKEIKEFLSKNYQTAIGQFDLYTIFYERGWELIKENGILSFISSNTFISNKDFYSFRKFILTNTAVLEILNLGETVFKDANLDVAILTFKKSNKMSDIKIAQNRNDFDENNFNIVNQKIFIDDDFEITINANHQDLMILKKLQGLLLSEILDLPRGIEFGSNSEKIFRENKEGSYKIIFGKSIDRYSINFDENYCFFENNISVFKEKHIYTSEKILIQRIRNLSLKRRIVATLDNDCYLCTNTLRIGVLKNENFNLKYILALLNSNLINFLFLKKFLNKDIYAYQLQQIPIKNIPLSEQQPFIALAEQMLTLNSELQSTVTKFLRTLERKFDLTEPSKALLSWHTLDYKAFIKELAKKKIKLSLTDEADWEDYFTAEQQKAVALVAKIQKVDDEINQKLYALYGLDDGEIAVVNGGN